MWIIVLFWKKDAFLYRSGAGLHMKNHSFCTQRSWSRWRAMDVWSQAFPPTEPSRVQLIIHHVCVLVCEGRLKLPDLLWFFFQHEREEDNLWQRPETSGRGPSLLLQYMMQRFRRENLLLDMRHVFMGRVEQLLHNCDKEMLLEERSPGNIWTSVL